MAIDGRRIIGFPVMLLQDAEGMIVTIETKSGDLYRGFLDSAEDCMNCRMYNVLVVRPDGSTLQLDRVFVPGRQICMAVLPKMLEQAPIFKRVRAKKEGKQLLLGMGRGRHMAAMTRFGASIVACFDRLVASAPILQLLRPYLSWISGDPAAFPALRCV